MLDDDEILKRVNFYAPFCHGTDDWSADEIEKDGMIPRSERNGYSSWETEYDLPLVKDGIYLGSVKDGWHLCFESMSEASKDAADDPLVGGSFFIIDSLPDEFAGSLVGDPACEWQHGKECKNAWESLREMGTFAVKRRIPPKILTRMTPREFFRFGRKHGARLPETWKEFVTEEIMRDAGEEGMKWTMEHQPEIFDEYD